VEALVTSRSVVEVSVFDDLEHLSHSAAELFHTLAMTTIASKGRFVAALSGGSTPRRLYTLLGSTPYKNIIDWRRIHLFWADERCVPSDHPDSNYKLLRDTLLIHVPLLESNIHRVQGEADPDQAAHDYEQNIKVFFGTNAIPTFDLILLGVGEDGHTASLFPESPAIYQRERFAVPVYFEKPQLNRVTLTLPIINHAAHVLFLAAGRAKASSLHNILNQGNSRKNPAGLVRPEDGIVSWFIDREAAGK
jgi:6-phosphogluconolactonase